MSHIVIVAADAASASGLAEFYRGSGASVHLVAAATEAELAASLEALGPEAIDLLVCALPAPTGARPAAAATREAMGASLMSLTYLPFRAAMMLKPKLSAAGGRAVLLSRLAATMPSEDAAGLYLWRPFAAGAHALWRCLSVEWKADAIACPMIAVDGVADAAALAALIASAPNGELVDAAGTAISW